MNRAASAHTTARTPTVQAGVPVPPGLLPKEAVASVLPIGERYGLQLEEAAAVAGAVDRRRAEFEAGRACGRTVLSMLGYAAQAIPVGQGRAPAWPAGVVGSISHSSTLAVSVAARAAELDAIGIDVHPVAPVEPQLWPLLETADDRLPVGERELMEGLLFCCKEAVFKCWFTAGGDRILEFRDVRANVGAGEFVAWAPPPGPRVIAGRWRQWTGHWWSVAWVRKQWSTP